MSIDEIDQLYPLDPKDPDFPVAKRAMKTAFENPLVRQEGRQTFWFFDPEGQDPADMICVVDVASLGLIARGSNDWESYSARVRLYPTDDRYALRDVIEAFTTVLRERRRTTPVPEMAGIGSP